MRKLSLFIIVVLAMGLPLAAQQTTFIVSAAQQDMTGIMNRHGLTVVKELYDGPVNCVMLVTSPSANVAAVQSDISSDLLVLTVEPQQRATLPEVSSNTQPTLTQSTTSILDTLPGRTLVPFFGSIVPSNYSSQSATNIIRLADARNTTKLTGAGTVAVIDTGADFNHPALTSVLLPGYDFTHETVGGSELSDLSPAMAAQLQQSTTSILDAQNTLILNTSSVAILNQSTTSILDQSTTSILDSTLAEFGHGTMTAGIVHLVAPTAQIMPLKAFHADGSSDLSDIIRAIYFASDNGANVVSMSFSLGQPSPGLQAAIQYALAKNVTLVASSGNDGLKTIVYPAGFSGVEGVGSTNSSDQRSTFSNYGNAVVTFAAPGEGVITTYPGGAYAAGWGTSFSAPILAGAASLALQAKPNAKPREIINVFSNKTKQITNMGYGRIDLYQALTTFLNTLPANTSPNTGKF